MSAAKGSNGLPGWITLAAHRAQPCLYGTHQGAERNHCTGSLCPPCRGHWAPKSRG